MKDDDTVLQLVPGGARASVSDPARALRAATAVRAVLEELRGVEVDDGVRARLADLLRTTRGDLAALVSDDLSGEVEALGVDDPDAATAGELRLALARLLGWTEGLFHGVSADLVDTADELGPGRNGHYL